MKTSSPKFNRWISFTLISMSIAWASAGQANADVTLTTLVKFDGSNGTGPWAGLISDASGNLYGTTYGGGINNYGTVFQLAAGTHALTTLVNFDNWTNGRGPMDKLIIDASGNLYGTTSNGGAGGSGTVFQLATGTHALTTLATFQYDDINGSCPMGGVIADASGNLYGTTSSHGAADRGTVFKIDAGTHTLTTLAAFEGNNGSSPRAKLFLDASGNLYGTTSDGGAGGNGTVFKVDAGTHTLTTLVNFDGSNGGYPFGGLISDTSGNLYGTTYSGGSSAIDGSAGAGTVFKLSAGTNALTMLVNFDWTNGRRPMGELIIDANGNLYGTTEGEDGPNVRSPGTVFKIAAGTNELTTLYTFDGITGGGPFAGLLADANGNLYGTTQWGGINDQGTVFELSGTGFVTPEPATLSLLALGGVALLKRRRK